MITDEERRDVARKLLKIPHFSLGHVAYAIGYDEEDDDWDEVDVINRLADLIEPVERMCLYYDAVTNHCGCYDTRLIDRDALLALADEMDELCGPWHDCGKHYARRIREALGVER